MYCPKCERTVKAEAAVRGPNRDNMIIAGVLLGTSFVCGWMGWGGELYCFLGFVLFFFLAFVHKQDCCPACKKVLLPANPFDEADEDPFCLQ